MRKNEYSSLEQFVSEYTGKWEPAEGHWLGLDFKYNGNIYRLNTGSMYSEQETLLSNGKTALFGIYRRNALSKIHYPDMSDCELLGEYADMSDLLESTVIEGLKFKLVIMDDNTEILGKD